MKVAIRQKTAIAVSADIPLIVKGHKRCRLCSNLFDGPGYKLFTNYGAQVKSITFCSEECRNILHSTCGEGRSAFKKEDLKPIRLW